MSFEAGQSLRGVYVGVAVADVLETAATVLDPEDAEEVVVTALKVEVLVHMLYLVVVLVQLTRLHSRSHPTSYHRACFSLPPRPLRLHR